MLRSETKLFRAAFLAAVASVLLVSTVFGQSTGGVKGRVRTMRGDGIPGATVAARQNGTDIKVVTANAKGDFALDGLDAGLYNLVFDAKGFATGILYGVKVKPKQVNNLGDRLILSPDKGSLIIVNGSVFFKEGTSVAGAKIDLERVLADGTVKKLGSTITNLSGEFTYRQPEGAAKLRFTARYNGVTGVKELDVAEPAVYRFAITLDLSRNTKPQDK